MITLVLHVITVIVSNDHREFKVLEILPMKAVLNIRKISDMQRKYR